MSLKRGSKYKGRLTAVGVIVLIILSGGAINVPDGLTELISRSVI